jgi:hypothetical protein
MLITVLQEQMLVFGLVVQFMGQVLLAGQQQKEGSDMIIVKTQIHV